MVDKYPVITLCGSTKFKDDFIRVEKELSLSGNIILTCGLFNHADNEQISEETKIMLDDMHKRKIDMSDGIMVINVDDYIGKSTRSEIDYAKSTGKSIRYAFPHSINDPFSFHDYCNVAFCGTFSEDLLSDQSFEFYTKLGYVTWKFPELIFMDFPKQDRLPNFLQPATLDQYACKLIDMIDMLVVLNTDGLIGPVCQQAIDYAKSKNKIVEYALNRRLGRVMRKV